MQSAGALRPDVNAHDVILLLPVLRELRVAHRDRDPGLRQRFRRSCSKGCVPRGAAVAGSTSYVGGHRTGLAGQVRIG